MFCVWQCSILQVWRCSSKLQAVSSTRTQRSTHNSFCSRLILHIKQYLAAKFIQVICDCVNAKYIMQAIRYLWCRPMKFATTEPQEELLLRLNGFKMIWLVQLGLCKSSQWPLKSFGNWINTQIDNTSENIPSSDAVVNTAHTVATSTAAGPTVALVANILGHTAYGATQQLRQAAALVPTTREQQQQ